MICGVFFFADRSVFYFSLSSISLLHLQISRTSMLIVWRNCRTHSQAEWFNGPIGCPQRLKPRCIWNSQSCDPCCVLCLKRLMGTAKGWIPTVRIKANLFRSMELNGRESRSKCHMFQLNGCQALSCSRKKSCAPGEKCYSYSTVHDYKWGITEWRIIIVRDWRLRLIVRGKNAINHKMNRQWSGATTFRSPYPKRNIFSIRLLTEIGQRPESWIGLRKSHWHILKGEYSVR